MGGTAGMVELLENAERVRLGCAVGGSAVMGFEAHEHL